jgi:sensor c-di-GMP phosphodiesterase-like protein
MLNSLYTVLPKVTLLIFVVALVSSFVTRNHNLKARVNTQHSPFVTSLHVTHCTHSLAKRICLHEHKVSSDSYQNPMHSCSMPNVYMLRRMYSQLPGSYMRSRNPKSLSYHFDPASYPASYPNSKTKNPIQLSFTSLLEWNLSTDNGLLILNTFVLQCFSRFSWLFAPGLTHGSLTFHFTLSVFK